MEKTLLSVDIKDVPLLLIENDSLQEEKTIEVASDMISKGYKVALRLNKNMRTRTGCSILRC